jgi:DNA replication protein DnaC
MEKQIALQESLQQVSQKIDSPVVGIGFNKYQNLKNLPFVSLTDLEKSQISEYEAKHLPSKEQSEASKKYVRDMLSVKEKKSFSITALRLWNVFKAHFLMVNNKEFEKNEFTIKNLEPLIYYFAKDERFFNCENLSKLSTPSFDKGILIIGTFGNGKTAVMRTFEKIFATTKGVSFKGYSANEVVTMFEKCVDAETKADFNRKMNLGDRYFDDIKTERQASNYGKVNLFKDILENRYNNRIQTTNGETKINRTFGTCNYKERFEGNSEVALEEFGEMYGGRVYDRMFEMFNIVEFKGKSFRK